MNQPKRNLKIWIPIAAVLCFWLGDWMGHTKVIKSIIINHSIFLLYSLIKKAENKRQAIIDNKLSNFSI